MRMFDYLPKKGPRDKHFRVYGTQEIAVHRIVAAETGEQALKFASDGWAFQPYDEGDVEIEGVIEVDEL